MAADYADRVDPRRRLTRLRFRARASNSLRVPVGPDLPSEPVSACRPMLEGKRGNEQVV